MQRVVSTVVVLLALLALPTTASAAWTRIRTDHFTFIGDAPERDIRLIAQQLEQFRDVVGQVFSENTIASAVPTVVVVFANDRAFAQFRPMFQGKPTEVAGYFIGREDANHIAVNAAQEAAAYGVIFHEFAHFMVSSAVGLTPVWFNEGLAELYQTFEMSNGGRTALIGKPSRENLLLLQAAPRLMPVSELIAVHVDSPLYNEGERRGLLYAESWALVHYLTFGAPARSGQLRNYVTAIGRGDPEDQAFVKAFGDPKALDGELSRYIRSFQLRALRVEFNERIGATRLVPAQPLTDDDVAGYLGDLLARLNRPEDARALLQKTIDANPEAGRALSALGLMELRSGKEDAAFPLLEKGAELLPADAAIQSAFGRVLTRRADLGRADSDDLYRKARTVLARALEIEPDNVSSLVTLAEVEMGSGANTARAVELMQRVVKAAPAREEYRLLLGQAMAVNGDYRGASAYLSVMLARGSTSEIREAARRALARVATAEREARTLASEAERRASADAPEAPRPTMEQGAYIPTLRSLQAGESRVMGQFSAVECLRSAIVLQVDAASGPVRLAVKGFDEVEFLTYRPDSPTSVACGPQKPSFRVLATFRTDAPVAGANTPNRAVAIELLPDGFTPK